MLPLLLLFQLVLISVDANEYYCIWAPLITPSNKDFCIKQGMNCPDINAGVNGINCEEIIQRKSFFGAKSTDIICCSPRKKEIVTNKLRKAQKIQIVPKLKRDKADIIKIKKKRKVPRKKLKKRKIPKKKPLKKKNVDDGYPEDSSNSPSGSSEHTDSDDISSSQNTIESSSQSSDNVRLNADDIHFHLKTRSRSIDTQITPSISYQAISISDFKDIFHKYDETKCRMYFANEGIYIYLIKTTEADTMRIKYVGKSLQGIKSEPSHESLLDKQERERWKIFIYEKGGSSKKLINEFYKTWNWRDDFKYHMDNEYNLNSIYIEYAGSFKINKVDNKCNIEWWSENAATLREVDNPDNIHHVITKFAKKWELDKSTYNGYNDLVKDWEDIPDRIHQERTKGAKDISLRIPLKGQITRQLYQTMDVNEFKQFIKGEIKPKINFQSFQNVQNDDNSHNTRQDKEWDFIVLSNQRNQIRLTALPDNRAPTATGIGHSSMLTDNEYRNIKDGKLGLVYAGEIHFDDNGVVDAWSCRSGHFWPDCTKHTLFGNHWGLNKDFLFVNQRKNDQFEIIPWQDAIRDALDASVMTAYDNQYDEYDENNAYEYDYDDIFMQNDRLIFMDAISLLSIISICIFGIMTGIAIGCAVSYYSDVSINK